MNYIHDETIIIIFPDLNKSKIILYNISIIHISFTVLAYFLLKKIATFNLWECVLK